MSIVDLEKTVEQLPPSELEKFTEWFENFISDQWDKQMESDIKTGKLDKLASQTDLDFEAGHCKPL